MLRYFLAYLSRRVLYLGCLFLGHKERLIGTTRVPHHVICDRCSWPLGYRDGTEKSIQEMREIGPNVIRASELMEDLARESW